MNAIYKIVGEDGKEYGPATVEQIRQWIVEGRIERRTPVFVAGTRDWNFVGLLPELANCFAETAPPTIAPLPFGTSTTGRKLRTNLFAMWGMILGIGSWMCCCYGIPLTILSLIFSLVGLSQINRQPEIFEGRGMAIAGLVLSIAHFVIFTLLIVFALATGNPKFGMNIQHF